MSRALIERNLYIYNYYDPERRNGEKLAKQFNISRVRVHQIYVQMCLQKGKEVLKTKKYDGILPSYTIEKEVEREFRELANRLRVSLATLLRWSAYDILKKYPLAKIGDVEPPGDITPYYQP